jgi:preprotein translocase subunit SecB
VSDETQQPIFSIVKIYVKDMSVEVPGAPQVFLQGDSPKIEVQLAQNVQTAAEGLYEVTLVVTVTAKAEERTLFLAEAHQAGLFQIRNVPDDDMAAVLGMVCPNVLFPYARETISDVINRAGFPPVLLAPVNFEALYQQRIAEQQSQGQRIEVAR